MKRFILLLVIGWACSWAADYQVSIGSEVVRSQRAWKVTLYRVDRHTMTSETIWSWNSD